MDTYSVLRTFGNTYTPGELVELDPDDDGTKALLRDGYIEPGAIGLHDIET